MANIFKDMFNKNEQKTAKILIVEDKAIELQYAIKAVEALGFDYATASTLSEGLEKLPEADMLLTDMCFPAGTTSIDDLVEEIKPHIKAGVDHMSHLLSRDVPELLSYMATNEDGKNDDSITNCLDGILWQTQGLKTMHNYGISISNGAELPPCGIEMVSKASELGTPYRVITSEFHHGPVKGLASKVLEERGLEPLYYNISTSLVTEVGDAEPHKDWAMGLIYGLSALCRAEPLSVQAQQKKERIMNHIQETYNNDPGEAIKTLNGNYRAESNLSRDAEGKQLPNTRIYHGN